MAGEVYKRRGIKPVLLCTTEKDAGYYRSQIAADVPAEVLVLPDRYSLIQAPEKLPSLQESMVALQKFERDTGYLFVRDMLLPDRQFARSFLVGADKIAKSKSTARATPELIWRVGGVLADFARRLAETHPPALFVCLTGGTGMATRPLTAATRLAGGQMRNLVHTRFGYRYYWAEDEKHNAAYLRDLLSSLPMPADEEVERVKQALRPTGDFEFYVSRMRSQRRLDRMAIHMARNVWKHIRYHVSRSRKAKIGYYMMGELGMIMNARRQARFLVSDACTRLADLPEDKRTVFFPLQVEPEISLHALVPDYFDQLNSVGRIAMNLPADTLLLVKEHPAQIGRRGKEFYDRILAFPNVRLISETEHSYPIIRRSDLIIAVTSSAAHEAAVMGRKVVYLHQSGILDHLPHVKYLPPEKGFAALSGLLNDEGQWPSEEDRIRFGVRYYAGLEQHALDFAQIGTDIFNRNREVKESEVAMIVDSLEASLQDDNLAELSEYQRTSAS
ncbi:MAG: hypothetical protein R8L07_12395 [Alphaproteobacteria bacterium]|nr:hypothetical protein [Alphaproteobacteria bacterium]